MTYQQTYQYTYRLQNMKKIDPNKFFYPICSIFPISLAVVKTWPTYRQTEKVKTEDPPIGGTNGLPMGVVQWNPIPASPCPRAVLSLPPLPRVPPLALTHFGANLGLVWQTSPFPLCVGYNKLVQSPLTAQWMRWRIFYLKDHSIKNLRKSE